MNSPVHLAVRGELGGDGVVRCAWASRSRACDARLVRLVVTRAGAAAVVCFARGAIIHIGGADLVRPAEANAILPGVEPANAEAWEEVMAFGTLADVKRLLDEGLSPNVATKSGGVTALMAAAPDVDKMRLLLDRGADVNARSKVRFTALMVAAQYQGSDAAMNLLLDRGARVAPADGEEAPVFNANAFFIASYAGNAAILQRLGAGGRQHQSSHVADRHLARRRRCSARSSSATWRSPRRSSTLVRRSISPTAMASRCSDARCSTMICQWPG